MESVNTSICKTPDLKGVVENIGHGALFQDIDMVPRVSRLNPY